MKRKVYARIYMGVTYKLKQEVIDYILELKRVDQSLSCRKVSELASTHFQKKISKSSVNAVIKDSSLSSPIGRRAKQETKSEKFKIPDHRKEQLFINIPMSLLGEPKPRESPAAGEAMLYFERLGILFLKAAEWQMKRQGVLRFFAEKFGPVLSEEKILKLAEAFLLLPFFGEQRIEKFLEFNQKNAWQMSSVDFEPTTYQKKECFDMLLGLEEKEKQISLEYGQIFSEASFFRFNLEDGSSFCIDGQKNASWEENNVHCDFSVCLDKVFDVLSKEIIINKNPVVLREATVQGSLSMSFLNMVSSFENLSGKKIKRVDIMTSQKEIFSSFEKVVDKKRYYIAGLYDCQGLLQKSFSERKQEPKTVLSSLTNQAYYYWEAATAFRLPDGRQISANMALVSHKKDQSPSFAILTNIPAKMQTMEKVLGLYLDQWPHPLTGHASFGERQKKTLQSCCDIVSILDGEQRPWGTQGLFEETSFLARLANDILGSLHDYCARHYFHPQDRGLSLAQAKERFYSLSGEIKKEDHFFRAKLIMPAGYSYRNELQYLIERVNESVPSDLKGRRLLFET